VAALWLTYDDGPDPVWTPALLDALRAADARATFFVLAPRARRHPELLRRAVGEGHAVAPHGDGHRRHTDMDAAAGRADLAATLGALAAAGVPAPRRWRTPWGVEAAWTRPLAAEHGLEVTGWDADTHDWRGDNAQAMLAAVRPRLAAPGTVVLAHDGLGPGARRDGCAETVALTAPLVALAREHGLEPRALA
jgi:peptidoglycan-N-acetylglucosamine deacetylase